MRLLTAGALMLMVLGLPANAQRGGARGGGGFAARSAPSFHGGFSSGGFGSRSFSAPVMHSISPYRAVSPNRGYGSGLRVARPSYPSAYQHPANGVRPGYVARDLRRPNPVRYPRERRFGANYGYPYAAAAWIAPWDLGYPDPGFGNDYDDSPNAQAMPPDNYIEAPPVQDSVPDVQGGYAPPGAPLPPEEATTLIFKDGRAPQRIYNYMLTRTTLTVTDGRRLRDVPLSDLDLQATIEANRRAGVAFRLQP